MKKKLVQIQIDEENFPMLFNVETSKLGPICYDIFQYGYNCYFPDHNELNPTNISTAIIRKDLDKITDHIDADRDIVSNRIDKFSNIIEELFGINSNASKKGIISEDMVYHFLKSKFKDYTIEETRHLPHHGDAVIGIPNNKLLVEIKNYVKPVDKDEIDKLVYDMKYTGIKHALFISIKSGFIGRKQMAIQDFQHEGETYTILYLPNIQGDITKIEMGVILLVRLLEYTSTNKDKNSNLHWLINNISDHLTKLDDEYTNFAKLKSQYQKMEKNIKQNLSDFYVNMRNYEIEFKDTINKIWHNVHNDFDKAEKDLISKDNNNKIIDELRQNKMNKNLCSVFDIVQKHHIKIVPTGCEDLWHLNNKNKLVGSIMRTKNKVNIVYDNFTYSVNNKKSINTELNSLDEVLGNFVNQE